MSNAEATSRVQTRGLAPPYYFVLVLPSGFVSGFATVTLAYVLAQHGVSVAAVAGLVSIALLPLTWQFVAGPVIDVSFTARRWYLAWSALMVAAFAGFTLAPLTQKALPALDVLIFAAAAAGVGQNCATRAAMAATTPLAKRGPVAAWCQAANLGGAGLGGGLGLWITTHAGGPKVAALGLALLSALCALPILGLRPPPRDRATTFRRRLTEVGSEMLRLIRTRAGVLAAIVVTIPAALGAVASIIASVAGQWRASADVVAFTNGALAGIISIPGCLVGGYLCRRFPSRPVYVWAALACAAEEAAMAFAPHTPAAFVGFILGYDLLLGVAYGAFSTVIFECLGPAGAATVGALFFSLANLPVLLGTLLVGAVGERHGADAMLLTEAGLAAAALAAYASLAWLWRPAAARQDAAFAAEAA